MAIGKSPRAAVGYVKRPDKTSDPGPGEALGDFLTGRSERPPPAAKELDSSTLTTREGTNKFLEGILRDLYEKLREGSESVHPAAISSVVQGLRTMAEINGLKDVETGDLRRKTDAELYEIWKEKEEVLRRLGILLDATGIEGVTLPAPKLDLPFEVPLPGPSDRTQRLKARYRGILEKYGAMRLAQMQKIARCRRKDLITILKMLEADGFGKLLEPEFYARARFIPVGTRMKPEDEVKKIIVEEFVADPQVEGASQPA